MQYFVASLLALLGLANSSRCTELNGGQNARSGGPRVRLEVYPRVEEWPHSGPGKKLVLHKKNEPLNMTCTVVYQNGEKDDETLFDYTVDWKGPRHVNNNPKIERGQSRNTAWIWFERLTEKDAGDYTCIAVSHKPWGHQTTLSVFFYLFVEHKPTYCGPQWFRCRSKHCIMERYVCDGKQDCEEGEDESPAAGCGLDPCFGKVLCADRCIPPEWCCDHRNCSGTFGLRGGPWPHDNNEISYVQTAFYTVIGCAMAFMFIVTILVIAICRVQIKRAMNSRWSQPNRDVICGRRAVPLYDLDVYLNRNADANYPGGVSIMCNINSGVQFVGRPAEPPPYSEVVAEPPREGPPPPYVSRENLIVRVPNSRFLDNTGVDVASRRSIGEPSDANPPDTDVRNGTNGNGGESSVPNVPGPQVPTYSYLPQGRTIVDRDTDSLAYRRITDNSLYSRDTVDASTGCSETTTRNRPSTNFELEYVETDALLTDNSNNCSTTERDCSKEAATPWKPYKCNALVGSLWLNNERRDKRPDKNWYRQTIGKAMKDFSGRETSSHKDSENEGVFLDTDQQESIRTITNDIVENDTSNASSSSSPSNVVDSVASRDSNDKNVVPSCSNSTMNSEAIPSFSLANKDRKECVAPGLRDDLEITGQTSRKITENNILREKKIKSEDDRAGKKNSSARNSRSRTKRQGSLTNGEASSQNFSDASVCAVVESGKNLPNPDDDRTNTQMGQSSLVLPLRESFIGVQRDS